VLALSLPVAAVGVVVHFALSRRIGMGAELQAKALLGRGVRSAATASSDVEYLLGGIC
jgi:hypothetical protein